MVTGYAPGAGIGWRRDRPAFGVEHSIPPLTQMRYSVTFRTMR